MNMFRNTKVGTKLLGGFLFVSFLGAVVAIIGIASMGRINDMADEMYEKNLRGLSYIKEANINLIYAGRARANYLLATTTEEREMHAASIKKYLSATQDYVKKAEPLFVLSKEKEKFAQFPDMWKEYERMVLQSLSLASQQKLQDTDVELLQSLAQVRQQANALDKMMTELSDIKEEGAKAMSDQTTQIYKSSFVFMSILVIVSLTVGILLGLLITRSITRPLNKALSVTKAVATGDLTLTIESESKNEIGQLLDGLKEMNDSLVKIVSQVRTGTDTIATASQQIASGNLDLSSRTEEQASSLEETASSMEELTSTVKQNADNAKQANQLAATASDIAVRGGQVVSEVVHTMEDITESSKKIADIISVIDGIAFQTNILALNAAVEAARAGEQGRGFAVVASEVRNLAQRSASAAKEIKELITSSVGTVENGSRLVTQAGSTMNEIVDSVKRVTDIMAEITAASQEQASGIEQVNQAVAQMDEVTQQNAALVEEAAAASQSLQDEASNLAQVVSVFKLSGVQESTGQRGRSARTAGAGAGSTKKTKPLTLLPQAALQKNSVLAKTGSNEEWEEF